MEAYDTTGNGIADTIAANLDSDFDGLDNNFDLNGNGVSDPEAPVNGDPMTSGIDGQSPTSFPDDDAPGNDRDWRDPSDADNDGVIDDQDLDDDNDGISDLDEQSGLDPFGDEDGDGFPNFKDVVDNGSGDGSTTNYTDANGNGVPDAYDLDGDGIPNHLDSDADGDNCADADEAYGVGTDADDNGYFGSGTPAVDAVGLVTAAGVTGTTYNNTP